MAQKEDIVFCKIAIANGLVKEADAQKVLALCDKREREAGERPPIGSVFSKYNLLNAADVQKVYEAVRKRTGSSVGTAKARGAVGTARTRGAPGARKRGPAPRRRGEADDDERPAKPIDPATLWMGIGGIVVFIAILCTMLYLVLKPEKKPASATDSTESSAAAAPVATAPKESAKKDDAAAKPTPSLSIPNAALLEVKQIIADARSMRGDDPVKALSLLEAKKKELEGKSYVPPKDLIQLIAELKGESKKAPPAPAAANAADAGARPAEGAAADGSKAGEAPAADNLQKPEITEDPAAEPEEKPPEAPK